jgi:hypothetical protein
MLPSIRHARIQFMSTTTRPLLQLECHVRHFVPLVDHLAGGIIDELEFDSGFFSLSLGTHSDSSSPSQSSTPMCSQSWTTSPHRVARPMPRGRYSAVTSCEVPDVVVSQTSAVRSQPTTVTRIKEAVCMYALVYDKEG